LSFTHTSFGEGERRIEIKVVPRNHLKFAMSWWKAAMEAGREIDLETMRAAKGRLRRLRRLRKWIYEAPS
jgi:hypothetical protein